MGIAWEFFDGLTRIAVGGLLVAAGVMKLNSTRTWRHLWLASYELLPGPLVAPVALLLPPTELLCGIGQLAGAFGRVSVLAAAAVLALVTIAVVTALSRNLGISCGCLGPLGALVSRRIVARNAVLLAALAAIAVHGPAAPAIAALGRPWQSIALVTAGTAALAILAIYRRWQRHRLIAVFARSAQSHGFAEGFKAGTPAVAKER